MNEDQIRHDFARQFSSSGHVPEVVVDWSKAFGVKPSPMRHVPRVAAVAAFLILAVAANWVTAAYKPVTWDLGWASLTVTAGTYAAGLVLLTRDWIHDTAGKYWAWAAIAGGSVASWWMTDSPRLAIASAAAFAVSEAVDLWIYQPLRRKNWARAATVSNLGGSIVDSIVFLFIAGWFSWSLVAGQVIVKMVAALIVVGAVEAARRDA